MSFRKKIKQVFVFVWVASATLPLLVASAAEPADGIVSRADRFAAWQAAMKAYEPDLSDSAKHLEAPETGRLAEPIRIAEKGVAKAEIVVDLSDAIRIENFFADAARWPLVLRAARGYEADVARTAALSLQEGLRLLTGAEFPIVQRPTDEKNVKIYLGATFAKGLFDDDLAALAHAPATDGFAVRAKGGNLFVFGARPAGTLWGVHAFLENNSDLIWAYPGDGGTVFTKNPDLAIVWADAREIPAFFIRGWQGGDEDWKMRNRSNFDRLAPERASFHLYGGHYLCPQYYDFSSGIQKFNSMDAKGVRAKTWDEYRHHACLSDPAFLSHALETVPQPATLGYTCPDVCVIGMDDNAAVCHCPTCTAPIRALDGTMLTPEKNGEDFWSAWFYTYLNKVDDEIQKLHPGYTTSTFAYFFAKRRPPIAVNRTVVPFLCTYARGNYHLPVFAPKLEIWADIYEGWIGHTKELMLYDYYGLVVAGHPYAEIYKADLLYQRSIGFLATSTEGFMKEDALGTADERWCMARLAWNPDQDVEQLHRRFNRRTYREAAPHMDRIRGAVRKAYFAAGTDDLRKALAADAELKPLVAAELEAAEAAVRHPQAKRLVARSASAWRKFLGLGEATATKTPFEALLSCSRENSWRARTSATGETSLTVLLGTEIAFPKLAVGGHVLRFRLRPPEGLFETAGYPGLRVRDAGAARGESCERCMRPADGGTYLLDIRPGEGMNPCAILIENYLRWPSWLPKEQTLEIVDLTLEPDDGLPLDADERPQPLDARRLRQLKAAAAECTRSPLDKALAVGVETYLSNRMVPVAQRREALVAILERRIAAGEVKTAAEALDFLRTHLDDQPARVTGWSRLMNGWEAREWIARLAKAFQKTGKPIEADQFCRAWMVWDGEKTPWNTRFERWQATSAWLTHDADADRSFLAVVAEKATKSAVRGQAAVRQLSIPGTDFASPENKARIEGLLMDEFMANDVRLWAALRLPEAFRKGGKADARAVAERLLAAYGAGDWSNLARSCYSHQFGQDMMLEALAANVERLWKEGEKEVAKDLFSRGVKAIGYEKPVAKAIEEEASYVYLSEKGIDSGKIVASDIRNRYGKVEKLRKMLYPPSRDLQEDEVISLDED